MINTVIKRAVEGGYKTPNYGNHVLYINARMYGKKTANDMYEAYVLQSPQFWQCLGVAMGWKTLEEVDYYQYWADGEYECNYKVDEISKDDIESAASWESYVPIRTNNWLFHWHSFIDALASGKTAEEAMGEIIK